MNSKVSFEDLVENLFNPTAHWHRHEVKDGQTIHYMALPGLTRDDVTIKQEGSIILLGINRENTFVKKATYQITTKSGDVRASMKEGLLTLTFGKAKPPSRTINID